MKIHESEVVEIKKSTSELKDAIIAIAAMLNKQGRGTVYFGIDDDGHVLGQQVGKSTIKDIHKSISDHIEPKIYPEVRTQTIENKICLVVEFSGQDSVYAAFGRYYFRLGTENRKLSVDALRRLVEKKNNYAYHWGSEISGYALAKAETHAIRSFLRRGREVGRISFAFDSKTGILRKLHLSYGRKLLNAGRALFCRDSSVEVQAAVFAGKDKLTFLDIQSFRGNLLDLIEKSEVYIKEHLNWRADLSGSKRVEIPEIPIRALKEAIINSLCHRDFSNPKSNEIAIYRDRVEIFNPGQFPHEYDPADFVKGNLPSFARNPLIADVFYLSEDIEKWGSGLRRISEECKNAGVRVLFRKSSAGFSVVFYRPSRSDSQFARSQSEGVNEGVSEGVNALLNYIRSNPGRRVPWISRQLKVPQKTLERRLKYLREKGEISYKGSAKTGGYHAVLR